MFNYDNDFSGGTVVNSNLSLPGDKWFCIGDTCISQYDLQNIKNVISGKKNIYIYKQNDGNNYLCLAENGDINRCASNDSDDAKKKHGSWRISLNPSPENNGCVLRNVSNECIGN